MKKFSAPLLAVLYALLLALPALASSVKSPTGDYVSDFAGVLSAEAKEHINRNAKALEEATGAQIVFVFVETTKPVAFEAYVNKIYGAWNGKGVLIVQSIDDNSSCTIDSLGLTYDLPDGEFDALSDEYLEPTLAMKDYSSAYVGYFDALSEKVMGLYAAKQTAVSNESASGVKPTAAANEIPAASGIQTAHSVAARAAASKAAAKAVAANQSASGVKPTAASNQSASSAKPTAAAKSAPVSDFLKAARSAAAAKEAAAKAAASANQSASGAKPTAVANQANVTEPTTVANQSASGIKPTPVANQANGTEPTPAANQPGKTTNTRNDVVQPTGNYASDFAEVLSAEAKEHINHNAKALDEATGAQIVFVTVETTKPMSIDDYAYKLFNTWKIGDAEKNNGLLVLLAIGDDNYFTMEGTGLERNLPTEALSELWNEYLEPDFARKDYSAASVKYFDALYERVSDIYISGHAVAGRTQDARTSDNTAAGLVIVLILVLGIVIIVAATWEHGEFSGNGSNNNDDSVERYRSSWSAGDSGGSYSRSESRYSASSSNDSSSHSGGSSSGGGRSSGSSGSSGGFSGGGGESRGAGGGRGR